MLLYANTSDDEDANIGLNRNEISKNGKNSDFGLQKVVRINMAKGVFGGGFGQGKNQKRKNFPKILGGPSGESSKALEPSADQ